MDDKIFEKFSDSARKVLIASQKTAETMNSGIGSEHILIGLVVTAGTLAHDLLEEHMVSLDQIRLILSLHGLRTTETKGLSAEAKQILKTAVKLATEYGHITIDSEHLLLAVVKSKTSLAYNIIDRIGVNPKELGRQIEQLFSQLSGLNEVMTAEEQLPPPEPQESFRPNPSFQTSSAAVKTTTPALDYFTSDLTNTAQTGSLDPVIGREKEIQRLIQILCRRVKNNPVLIGDPGVGKTAIVEGLAQRIVNNKVPTKLENKRILQLDLALLVAGTMYRGQFEDRIKKLMEEIAKSGETILFVDELHTIVGAGSAEGSLDAANIFKPGLAKGKIRLVGATTSDEYRKYIEKDSALERRLAPIYVQEPSPEETIEILKGIRKRYEDFHHLKITDEAIDAAVLYSQRYIQDRFLPDKAIDLIDEAAAGKQLTFNKDTRLSRLQARLSEIEQEKETSVNEEDFERAAKLRGEELALAKQIEELKVDLAKVTPKGEQPRLIDKMDVARVVSNWSGVPLSAIIKDEKAKLSNLEDLINQKIVGQDEAIFAVASAIKRSKAGITDPGRPLGSFIFLGPTGVGKTELAKVLASEIYGRADSLVKVDMSEFMEKHNISRLVGAPPGYVGYEEAGKLTEQIRHNPYSVVLLDEIEKAHPDVFNMLLQILEDGYLTDARGRRVSFRNTIIIMTSNLGVKELTQQAALGFRAKSSNQLEQAARDYEQTKERILEELKTTFRPEFLNRIDKIIVFRSLGKKSIEEIVKLQLERLVIRLWEEKISLKYSKEAISLIAQRGYDPMLGARPIRRTIADLVENPLSDAILAGRYKIGDTIKLKSKKDQIVLG